MDRRQLPRYHSSIRLRLCPHSTRTIERQVNNSNIQWIVALRCLYNDIAFVISFGISIEHLLHVLNISFILGGWNFRMRLSLVLSTEAKFHVSIHCLMIVHQFPCLFDAYQFPIFPAKYCLNHRGQTVAPIRHDDKWSSKPIFDVPIHEIFPY